MIEKLSFEGGNRAIRLWNGNHDVCVIVIRDCQFTGTRRYAVEMSEIHVSLPGKTISGYARLDEKGELVEVEDPDAPALAFSSTYLHVYNCDFKRCGAVLFSACDMATMEDCSIETSPEMKGAAIHAVGLLKLENIRGVAHVKEGNGQRWIDLAFGNVPQLYARGLNLSSDSAAGIPVVYSLVRLRVAGNANHAVVVLQDSQFQVSGCPENAVVYCLEVPNKIVISGCTQTGKTEVPAIGLSGKQFDEDYFESFDNIGSRDLTLVTNRGAWIPMPPEGLAYLIDDDNKNMGTALPAPMVRYARLPLPKPIRALVKKWSESKKDEILSENHFIKNISRRLNAAD
ncbi:MAG: hypothetical protein JNM63_05950, partial [Spirochaetia bacterium]|nr:hypothetical protein [Spirochaetia bacterium]